MIERLLDRLVRFAQARAGTVLVGALLGAAFSASAFTVPFDFSFSGVMNREHPEVARYFAASERYGLGGALPLLVEGPEERLGQAVLDVRRALAGLEEVRSVHDAVPRAWLIDHAPWLVTPELFEALVASARAPDVGDAGSALDLALERLQASLAPAPPVGSRLVRIVMTRDTFELALDSDDFPTIREVAEQTLAPLGVTARFAGMPAIVTQEQEATIERMRVLGPLSLVLVLAILFWVERRGWVLASIAVPMLLSVGCTFAIVGFVAGKLTLMESIFGVMVFGLGIDFAIHLLLRVREERGRGLDFEASMHRAVLGTGRGVVAGAVTTAGAFFILAFAPDPVFFRLGLAGGLGLSLCLGFLLLMLPAAWAWAEARSPVMPTSRPFAGYSGLGRIARACASTPRVVLAVGAVVFLAGGFGMASLRYETNLERVFSREIDAVETARRIQALFGVDPGPWLVATDDLEDARSVAAAFEADPMFERTESLASLLRTDSRERAQVLDGLVPELAPGTVEGASGLLQRAHALGPPELGSLPAVFRERLLGPNGEFLVYAFTAGPHLDSAIAADERRAAQAIDPRATSMSAIYEALIGTDRPWMPPIVAALALFIAVVIRLDLGSTRLAVLALLPVVTSGVLTLGGLAAAGLAFNTVTLVAVPLLLGLGVDDGIHVVHRILEEPDSPLEQVVASVARSIGLTTATTCGSVGLLLFTRHPGIESVAILLLVGLPLALLATVTLVPAAATVMGAQSKARRLAAT